MSKKDWAEIELYIDAVKGIQAMEKITNERPFISLGKRGQELWEQASEKHDKFFELPIQERLYFSGMATKKEAKL